MEIGARPPLPVDGFKARHLIGVDDLSRDDVNYLLDLATHYARFLEQGRRPPQCLAGKTQINLFFEDSTRTNLSFELAGKKLGADVINVPVAASSVNKSEGLIDTAQTLAAMGAHAMIMRHGEAGIHNALTSQLPCPVINAGDGAREHPTQALLDAATLKSVYGSIEGRKIAICGDIKHSRVAGSDARLFTRLGAKVCFVGPKDLMPDESDMAAIPRIHDLPSGLDGADVVMPLRMQFERMENDATRKSAVGAYFAEFGISHQTLRHARPDAFVMHPGPMNRGVEIDGALADDPNRSLILRQVFYGVATRMACLDALISARAEGDTP